MKLIDWFDINKKEHLEAYHYMRKTNAWPEGFIPENVIQSYEDISSASKLANAFVDERLKRGYVPQQDAKKYKKYLKELTVNVKACLDAIDRAMKELESKKRGKQIAKICNALEMENDSARYFGLGVDHRTDKKKGVS